MKKVSIRKVNLVKMTKKCFSNNIVKIPYEELMRNRNNKEIFKNIEQAYGKDGLGILVIEKVPKFLEAKSKFFKLVNELMNLPESVLKKLERPEISYSLGYSYGKEYFGEKPDLLKASFYALLLQSNSNEKNDNNIWPEEIPKLRDSFHEIGNIMRENGLILFDVIDNYIKSVHPNYNINYRQMIEESKLNTGRLLYYYPRRLLDNQNVEVNNWCEWHNDHGSLTGLTSAVYIDKNGNEANIKLNKTGLYIQDRKGKVVRVTHGKDDIAYQVGETLQIHSGGLLNATPHAVKVYDDVPEDVARITFPLFMQPNYNVKLNIPKGSKIEDITTADIYTVPKIQNRFKENMTFEDFTNATHQTFYKV